MNVFIIGGCHIDHYGLRPHLGFVQQWATHLKLTSSEPVTITSLGMVKLSQVASLRYQYQLQLEQADLILLQLGHFELSWRKPFRNFFRPTGETDADAPEKQCNYQAKKALSSPDVIPLSASTRLKNKAKTALLATHQLLFNKLPFLSQFENDFSQTLNLFKGYRARVVVMTPFPTLHDVDQWLRHSVRPSILRQVSRAGFMAVDCSTIIPRQQTYFLADGVHLNSLGHLLLALHLSELPQPALRSGHAV